MMVLGQQKAVLVGTWWYLLIYDGTGSVWGGTGWYLVVLGQYGVVLVGTWWYMVLLGIKWYWVSKVLLCLYILKKKLRFGRVSLIHHRHTHRHLI